MGRSSNDVHIIVQYVQPSATYATATTSPKPQTPPQRRTPRPQPRTSTEAQPLNPNPETLNANLDSQDRDPSGKPTSKNNQETSKGPMRN